METKLDFESMKASFEHIKEYKIQLHEPGTYDSLYATMGGPSVPAIGWAAGIERLHILLEEDIDGNDPVNTTTSNFLHKVRNEKINQENNIAIMLIPLIDKKMESNNKEKLYNFGVLDLVKDNKSFESLDEVISNINKGEK